MKYKKLKLKKAEFGMTGQGFDVNGADAIYNSNKQTDYSINNKLGSTLSSIPNPYAKGAGAAIMGMNELSKGIEQNVEKKKYIDMEGKVVTHDVNNSGGRFFADIFNVGGRLKSMFDWKKDYTVGRNLANSLLAGYYNPVAKLIGNKKDKELDAHDKQMQGWYENSQKMYKDAEDNQQQLTDYNEGVNDYKQNLNSFATARNGIYIKADDGIKDPENPAYKHMYIGQNHTPIQESPIVNGIRQAWIDRNFMRGKYAKFRQTLPDNLKYTPNRDYDMKRFWRTENKPKDFNEGVEKGMYSMESDGYYHSPTLDNTGKFLKPVNHPTVGYELDWFHNSQDPEAVENRRTKKIIQEGKFYKYVPKEDGDTNEETPKMDDGGKGWSFGENGIVGGKYTPYNMNRYGMRNVNGKNVLSYTPMGQRIPMDILLDDADAQSIRDNKNYTFDPQGNFSYKGNNNGHLEFMDNMINKYKMPKMRNGGYSFEKIKGPSHDNPKKLVLKDDGTVERAKHLGDGGKEEWIGDQKVLAEGGEYKLFQNGQPIAIFNKKQMEEVKKKGIEPVLAELPEVDDAETTKADGGLAIGNPLKVQSPMYNPYAIDTPKMNYNLGPMTNSSNTMFTAPGYNGLIRNPKNPTTEPEMIGAGFKKPTPYKIETPYSGTLMGNGKTLYPINMAPSNRIQTPMYGSDLFDSQKPMIGQDVEGTYENQTGINENNRVSDASINPNGITPYSNQRNALSGELNNTITNNKVFVPKDITNGDPNTEKSQPLPDNSIKPDDHATLDNGVSGDPMANVTKSYTDTVSSTTPQMTGVGGGRIHPYLGQTIANGIGLAMTLFNKKSNPVPKEEMNKAVQDMYNKLKYRSQFGDPEQRLNAIRTLNRQMNSNKANTGNVGVNMGVNTALNQQGLEGKQQIAAQDDAVKQQNLTSLQNYMPFYKESTTVRDWNNRMRQYQADLEKATAKDKATKDYLSNLSKTYDLSQQENQKYQMYRADQMNQANQMKLYYAMNDKSLTDEQKSEMLKNYRPYVISPGWKYGRYNDLRGGYIY